MAEEKALREAYKVLSDPRRRERYDAQLAGAVERAAEGSGRGALVVAVILGVGAIGGLGWYLAERSARLEQIRLQEERLAREAEAAKRRATAEEKGRTRQGLDAAIEEHKARKREEEERVRVARERRALELEVIRKQVEAERAADIERNKRR
jgi:DnaJ-class molecular chaperone